MGATDTTYYEFGFTGDGPAAGNGPCLRLWTEGASYSNFLIFQEVTLEAGIDYKISGAFCDITPDGGVQNFWCEFDVSPEAPVEGVDYKPPAGANSDILLSFNTWTDPTCGPEVDGTFQGDACGGQNIEECPGIDVPSGIYFYRLKSAAFTAAGKMMLLR